MCTAVLSLLSAVVVKFQAASHIWVHCELLTVSTEKEGLCYARMELHLVMYRVTLCHFESKERLGRFCVIRHGLRDFQPNLKRHKNCKLIGPSNCHVQIDCLYTG
jgi:hypothetical protein